jgi:GT2 family glycosyltransferase
MNYRKGISVVIPNYNGRYLLEENLPSLYDALKNAKLPIEIIVSDDCSTDDSIDFLKLHYPSIQIVSTTENSGFPTTCNIGIAEAEYGYTCIVNTDVTFKNDYFQNSIKYFNNTNLFAVKGDIINYREHYDDVFDTNKDIVVYFKGGYIRFKNKDISGSLEYDYVAVLLGCCFICRTELLKNLGGFDEIFSPYYREDLDLAMRAFEHGYEILYVPDCPVYHKIGSTIERTQSSIKKQLIAKRNKFLLTWKHLDGFHRWIQHILFVFVSLLSRWIIFDWKWYTALVYALIRTVSYNKKKRMRSQVQSSGIQD